MHPHSSPDTILHVPTEFQTSVCFLCLSTMYIAKATLYMYVATVGSLEMRKEPLCVWSRSEPVVWSSFG